MSEPVTSQEAEARDFVVNAGRSFGGPNRGPGGRDSLAAINGALDAYAAAIRASERERYAALDIPSPEECICQEVIKARGLVELDCGYHMYEDLFTALRALAGQSEEVTG